MASERGIAVTPEELQAVMVKQAQTIASLTTERTIWQVRAEGLQRRVEELEARLRAETPDQAPAGPTEPLGPPEGVS